jgi:hypothetical protein
MAAEVHWMPVAAFLCRATTGRPARFGGLGLIAGRGDAECDRIVAIIDFVV